MKSKRVVLLTACLLAVSGCTPSTSGSSFKMSKITADDEGMHWDEVEGAVKYSVVVNDEDTFDVTAPDYGFETDVGEYEIKVTAIDKDGNKSDTATFNYETKNTYLSSVTATEGVITWGEYDGVGVEIKGQKDEDFTPIVGESYTVTHSDLYILQAMSGYEDNVYYTTSPYITYRQKGVLVSMPASDVYVIEDGSAEDDTTLAEIYSVKKFPSSSWVDTTASIVLDPSNKGLSDGKCVRLNYWHHGVWFKYTKDISVDKRYDTFSFKIKGTDATYTSLTFEITDHVIVGNEDLIGVYISYQLNPVDTQWTNYTVSLDDPNWIVDYRGSKQKFSDLKPVLEMAGYTVNSLADMMPFFKQFSFRVNATYNDKGTDARVWFDDVSISNVGAASKKVSPIVVSKNYAVASDAFSGNAVFNDDNTASLNITLKNGGSVQLPCTYQINEGELNMVCEVEGFDFDATFTSKTNGDSFELSSIKGSGVEAFSNFKASKYLMLEDFESYTETGTGYDSNNNNPVTPIATSLRTNYYCDFYNSENKYVDSPLGGSGWKLMGSTNYLDLYKNGEGMNNSKCARMKQNSGAAMRYVNYGLFDGSAAPFTGKYFSFFVKGYGDYDVTLKVRVFSINQIGPSTAASDQVSKVKSFVVSKDCDWTEITMELSESTTYYGFSITPQTDSTHSGQATFFYVDNINVHGDLSPWAK